MIISASRRTDIPNYFSDWFFKRLQAGFCLSRNPMNYHQINNVNLKPECISGIVFWTKNPRPMLKYMDHLASLPYYFQFTLTSYGNDIEQNLPSKENIIIPTFQELSKKIGSERVIWRYDPIFLSPKYDINWHLEYFTKLCHILNGFTNKIIISFLDIYKKIKTKLLTYQIYCPNDNQKNLLISKFVEISHRHNMTIAACAEELDFSAYGVEKSHCIDGNLLSKLGAVQIENNKDHNQRPSCGCFPSVDIGAYNCCNNACIYCYANSIQAITQRNILAHSSDSPVLIGSVKPEDIIKGEKMIRNQFQLQLLTKSDNF